MNTNLNTVPLIEVLQEIARWAGNPRVQWIVDRYVTSCIASPEGVHVLNMVAYKGDVIVATTEGVYRLNDDGELSPVKFADGEGLK